MNPMDEEDFKNSGKEFDKGITTWQIPKWDSGEALQYLLKEEKKSKSKTRNGLDAQAQATFEENHAQHITTQ